MTYVRFSPKRPIKSFQDLEVYQKLLAVSVAVAKRIRPAAGIVPDIVSLALSLPRKIATAHSLRFTDQSKATAILEEVMLNCNVLVVYLEQYRDIENSNSAGAGSTTAVCNEVGTRAESCVIENEFFEEQIRALTTCRWKVMHLARSWEKFKQTQ